MTKTDRVNKTKTSLTILSSSPFWKQRRHWTCSSGHAPLCHLQLIMGKIGEEGTGQGRSHEKGDGNRLLSAITSGYKKGVKCQQDNNCPKASKLQFVVTFLSRGLSILVKLYKQKDSFCVCACVINPHQGNVTLSYSWRPLESELSLRVLEILCFNIQFIVCY